MGCYAERVACRSKARQAEAGLSEQVLRFHVLADSDGGRTSR